MSLRKRAAFGLSLAVAATGFYAQPASANPAGTGLVISEVYGGGGNSGATYTHDFIELYNPTAAAISVEGKSVQYRSATGTGAGAVTPLSGSVPPGGHYLIQQAAGAAGTTALPAPDATGTTPMAGGGGQVWIADTTAALTPPSGNVSQPAIIDFAGASNAATSFETARLTTAVGNTTSASRSATGADTDNNATDFTVGTPSPANSGGGTPPPPEEVTATIAEIQGTGPTSPLAGKIATTRGVVTAAYPTGGLDGFYIQTPGAATENASDAVFVYGSAATSAVKIGDHVEVVGLVKEFSNTTELETDSASDVTVLTEAAAPITPQAIPLPRSEADREAHEGELLAPTNQFTVTNTFSTHQYAEIGLATGTTPLIAPTEVVDAQDKAGIAAATAENAARAITIDDGASVNFLSAANAGTPVPWLSKANPIRVGAPATLHAPLVLEYRNSTWKLQPTSRVTDAGASVATFVNTRTPAPENVGGDIRLATFNVLNYFPTTAEDFVAMGNGRTCTTYKDRDGNPITANSCTPDGPRGAADEPNFQRQQAKIVAAINKLGASVVGLEEIENSIKFGLNRDAAVSALVDALNQAAGSNVWAFAPSPAAADLPLPAEEDVIRTAFIYKPADVALVGGSRVLKDEVNFDNAREPLAQAFKRVGTPDTEAFAVIVNHFKSKGSGVDDGTGQGNANPDRIGQAQALSDFADSFAAERGTEAVFLTGDFNAYSEEDPVQLLEENGFHAVDSDTPNEETYSFSGLSGSLDHVFANDAALAMVTGADVWSISSGESLAFEYSRYNYNVTEFYEANPYRASDHDPEVVGIDTAEAPSPTVDLNILGINDFHGRINANTVKFAGTIEQLTAGKEDNTLLVGAGDLIGASEFASAVDNDQPAIDVLNAVGLDASAVGNHEFDQGFADLRDRVIGAEGSRNAQWDYLGANVYAKGTTDPVLPEYASFNISGVDVAVVGAVTEETKSLVSPAGIADLTFGNPVDAVNRVAGELSDGDVANGEADVVIAAFHAGATQGTSSNYAAEIAKGGEFAQMANLDDSVDVIFNGHTHQVYAWDAPVPGQTTTRPIVQTGEYASNVGQVSLTYDRATGEVTTYQAKNVARTTVADATLVEAYPRVAQVKTIVDAATKKAAEVGNQPVGSITADVTRAFSGGTYTDGRYVGTTTEDRASESTLGDLVADSLRDGLPADIGSADLGIVNPGGLRADLKHAAGDTTANPANTEGVVTYAEANAVLPFVNNVSLVSLTGAQLKSVLEEQWQPVGSSRPFLALGLSDNVQVTQDAAKPAGSRITSVIVNGEPLDRARTYTVSTFSFLAAGGDNFTSFRQGTARDTGLVDRDLWIGYLKDNAGIAPDFARQQVAESGLPSSVVAGDEVSFTLSKLNLTSFGSPENTTVSVYLRNADESLKVGDFPVTNGTAQVSFTAPADLAGSYTVVANASPSKTRVGLPLTAARTSVAAAAADMTYGTDGSVTVTVTSDRPVTGDVEVLDGETVLGTTSLSAGTATVVLPARSLTPGRHTLAVRYMGDEQNNPSGSTVAVSVAKAVSTVSATASPATVKVKRGASTVAVTVAAKGVQPTGDVRLFVGGSMIDQSVLRTGAVTLTAGPFDTVGTKILTIRYLGSDTVAASETTVKVEVTKSGR